MNTKIITGYWMDIVAGVDRKYNGSSVARKDRYKGSIISHCRGFKCPVICYTHQRNLQELVELKEEYNLTNLEIKVKELHEIKYSKQILEVENLYTMEQLDFLNGRPPEALWGKFDVMKEECTPDVERIYWMDAGLQSNQIFPYKWCPEENNAELFKVPYKQYNFTKVFNKEMLDKLNIMTAGKFAIVVSPNAQDGYYSFEDYSPKPGNYPIAGFFGGDPEIVKEFCDRFTDGVNMYIKNNTLSFEQSIMKYAEDKMPEEKLLHLNFYTHQSGIPEQVFHFDGWTLESGYPRPIYAIWEEILNS